MFSRVRSAQLIYALSLLIPAFVEADGTTPVASVATQFSLTTSTSIPFPTATLGVNDTDDFLKSSWSLSRGRISNGNDSIEFVSDPFPSAQVAVDSGSSFNGTVLRVTYPKGSFNNNTGGAQFYTLWNSSTAFQSMLVSYELAFDSDFDWVKGGKLPGIRGGPSTSGCSDGKEPDGTDCFSARLMWRKDGEGEGKRYPYILTDFNLMFYSVRICSYKQWNL